MLCLIIGPFNYLQNLSFDPDPKIKNQLHETINCNFNGTGIIPFCSSCYDLCTLPDWFNIARLLLCLRNGILSFAEKPGFQSLTSNYRAVDYNGFTRSFTNAVFTERKLINTYHKPFFERAS